MGIELSKDANILDFGCGAGRTVYSLLDQGYVNVVGFDVKDYLELRKPEDRHFFFIADPLSLKLPFPDGSFDLILSEEVFEHVLDQIGLLRELHRIMRPGGYSLHSIPSAYRLIEPHILVPLGGVLGHRWWYKLWSLLGIRNKYQKGLTADETADRNAYYYVGSLNYVPNSFYKVIWKTLGYEYKWIDQEIWDSSERIKNRWIGKMNRVLPVFSWIRRTFVTRRVALKKCV